MRISKVNTDFSKKGNADLLKIGLTVIQAMTNNTSFPAPTPTLEEVQAGLDDYQLKLAKANQKGSPLDISLKNESKAVLQNLLQQLAYYVNLCGKGNLSVLLSSGFEVAAQPVKGLVPGIPERLKLSDGALSGQMRIDFDALSGSLMYEYVFSSGRDESGELIWSDRISTTSSRRNILPGLIPGTLYSVRVRALNSTGPGAWCDPVSLIAR